ncbi:MAG: TetR/AcrR family transcriptional regulator [Ktedonobacterales bacterium]
MMVTENRERAQTGSSSREGGTHVRVRRRGTDLEEAILEAAWDELVAVGYAHLTVDGVAARARTSKAVLYRRWPNLPALVLASMRHHGPILSGPVPDTGSLRGDVLALLYRISDRFAARGLRVVYSLLSEYFRDDELFSYLQTNTFQVGSDVMMTILKRAAERGEVQLDTIPPRVVTLPVDLFRHEFLVTRAVASQEAVLQIVDGMFLPLVQLYGRGGIHTEVAH